MAGTITLTADDGGSVLWQAAHALAAGQSIKLATSLPSSVTTYSTEGENFTQWACSAYYDPTRKEVGFIGKRASTYPYHWLVYDEATNAWSNTRALWDTNNYSGHGYDHNTVDPATGMVYFRPAASGVVHTWDGSWDSLADWSVSVNVAGGLAWFPGTGLIYADGFKVLRYSGGSWSTLQNYAGSSYHDFAEYNSTANVLIFGGGNGSPYRKMIADTTISTIASPSFTIGASSDQGLAVSDPNSAALIAYERGGSYAWLEYDITADEWTSLTESTGDGSSAQTGTPNLPGSTTPLIACEIPQYGVTMWIKTNGNGPAGAAGEVWLYRHS